MRLDTLAPLERVPSAEGIMARLERLERANRRLRALALAPSLTILVALLMAPQGQSGTQQDRNLRAETLEVDSITAKSIITERVLVRGKPGVSGFILLDALKVPRIGLERGEGTLKQTTQIAPSLVLVESGGHEARMHAMPGSARTSAWAGIDIGGPPRPGAKNPLAAEASDDTERRALEALPFRQTRASLNTSPLGTRLEIKDGLDRVRAGLGSRDLNEDGKTRSYTEGTLVLFDETGTVTSLLPAKR